MNSRELIRNIVLAFENKYPVNDWELHGFKIWPYLRIQLFFALRQELDGNQNNINNKDNLEVINKSKNLLSDIKIKISSRLKKIYYTVSFPFILREKISNFPIRDHIFLGANSHRIDFKGFRFNRYFDTFIANNSLEDNYLYYEYDEPIAAPIYNPKNIVRFNDLISLQQKTYKFHFNQKLKGRDSYQFFLEDLKQNKYTKNFCSTFEPRNIIFHINYIHHLSRIFEKFLLQTNAKKIHILCYYSSNVFAFILAANKLGIETIEMQHGAQTSTHLAYGSWSKIPKEGYILLPRTFWHWDKDSSDTIKSWSKNIPDLKSVVVGNPWVNYWLSSNVKYDDKDFILYTLQPKPYTVDQLFTESIIKLISHTKRKWFVRLHPRQDNKEEILDYLSQNKILDCIEIEKASADPLPLLIQNCRLHVTNSSGSTIEAEMFNKKTILIDEIGKIYYPETIERNNAIFIQKFDKDFHKKMSHYIENIRFNQHSY